MDFKTIEWVDDKVVMIDQRKLPAEEVYLTCQNHEEVARAIRDMVREVARNEIAPHAVQWDRDQHFPRELFRQLGELGLLGVLVPEELGGAGLGYVEYVLILEEIGAADGSIGLSVAAHNSLCTNHLYLFGSDDLKREYLPRLASGEWIGAWGLTEPQAGSDAGSVTIRRFGTLANAVRSSTTGRYSVLLLYRPS